MLIDLIEIQQGGLKYYYIKIFGLGHWANYMKFFNELIDLAHNTPLH